MDTDKLEMMSETCSRLTNMQGKKNNRKPVKNNWKKHLSLQIFKNLENFMLQGITKEKA